METRLRLILDPATVHRAPARGLSLAIAAAFVVLTAAMTLAPVPLQAMGILPQAQHPPGPGDMNRGLLTQAGIDSIVRPVFIDKMADAYIAGAAMAVVYDGKVVYQGGFGRREVYHELPVEPETTVFRIGSITKVLTGVAVMQLVDRGLLDLDADVNRYLTTFSVPGTFAEPVRVRDLLTHTAGFDQIGLGRHAGSRDQIQPLGEFLSHNLIRIRPPREVSTYDTYAITLAGYLVERLSGLSYDEYLQRNLFEPLEMHRSGVFVPAALQPDVAVGYEFRGEWFPQDWEYMNTAPASSVNATVTDMANFAIMMLNGGRFKKRQVLSEASVHAMLTRQYTNDPDQPGYGLTFWENWSYGVPAFSHAGSMTGYGAFLYLVPEHHLGIFLAYNQESGVLPNAVLSRLMGALFPGSPQPPALRPRITGGIDLARFAGHYANSIYNHGNPTQGWRRRPVDLTVNEDGALVFQGAPAYRVGPLTFQRDDGVLLTFREDAQGRIQFLFVNQAVYEKLP
ncbi:MAG: serine hydrolase domain-containing protein, partial [Gemmatimonadales bacterium]